MNYVSSTMDAVYCSHSWSTAIVYRDRRSSRKLKNIIFIWWLISILITWPPKPITMPQSQNRNFISDNLWQKRSTNISSTPTPQKSSNTSTIFPMIKREERWFSPFMEIISFFSKKLNLHKQWQRKHLSRFLWENSWRRSQTWLSLFCTNSRK